MSIPLLSFTISFLGIMIMLGKKILLIRTGQIMEDEDIFFIDFKKIKYFTEKWWKKLRYASIFITLKFFIKSSNFIKTKGLELAKKIQNRLNKIGGTSMGDMKEKRDVSLYLKTISEYQKKIRNMKHRIKKEEGIE